LLFWGREKEEGEEGRKVKGKRKGRGGREGMPLNFEGIDGPGRMNPKKK